MAKKPSGGIGTPIRGQSGSARRNLVAQTQITQNIKNQVGGQGGLEKFKQPTPKSRNQGPIAMNT